MALMEVAERLGVQARVRNIGYAKKAEAEGMEDRPS